MTPIDLVPFAEHSQKLPSKWLAPVPQRESSTWKILFAHSIDFMMTVMIVSMITAIIHQAITYMLVTRGLKLAFNETAFYSFSTGLVPFVIFNYFFFSYFMNHGQTWGMYLVKKRIHLKSQSFMAALKWASHSTLVCLTCGIWFAVKKNVWESFKEHDYLYSHLMAHKDCTDFDLLNHLEGQGEESVKEVSEWKKAA